MLTSYYLPQTRSLLQLPGSNSTSLYSDADLTRFINIARGQVAGEGACIRLHASLSTIAGQDSYQFSALNTGVAATNGIRGVIRIESMHCVAGNGQLWMAPRPWNWFSLYNRNTAVIVLGTPTEWAQYGQGAAPGVSGSANGGTFYV